MSENENDLAIKEWINRNTCVSDKEWSKSQLQGLSNCENPFYDKKAENSGLPNHPSVLVMSKSGLEFSFQPVKHSPEPYNKNNTETFRTDFCERDIEKTPMDNIKTDAATAITETRSDFYKLLSYETPKFTKIPDEEYLCLAYQGCQIGFDVIEPITFSTFILDNGKIVTETWNYFDNIYRTYFGDAHSKQAAFNIRNHSENAFFVTVANRCFQIDNGEDVNKYYKKPTTSNRDKAVKIFTPVYKKLKGTWNTFAFSFYPVSQMDGEVKLPKMFLCEHSSKALTAELLTQQIERAMDEKLDQIDMELTFMANTCQCGNPNSIEEALVLNSTTPYNLYPILSYSHRLLLNLHAGKFDLPSKISARNIIAEVSFLQNGKPLKCIRTRWDNDGLTDKAFSRALYHEKSPQFEDQFIIELPIPCDGLICIKFFNLSTKPTDKPMVYFGNASIEISPGHDQFIIPDGKKQLAIVYQEVPSPNAKPVSSNQFTISTLLHSSLVTNVKPLKSVYNGESVVPSIDDIPDNELIYSLYQVLDSILTNIASDPAKAVKGLISLNRLTSVLSQENLESYLMNYVTELAFREGTNHDHNTHKFILKEWATILKQFTNVIGAERKDIYIINFMFHLIIKSIMVAGEENFSEELNLFVKEWSVSVCSLAEKGYQQSQKMNKSFAQFTSLLADIGLYSAASTCVVIFVTSFSDNPAEHRVILNFLEHALNPRLFLAETVVNDTFVPLFTDIFKKAVTKSPNDPIQQIFNVYARALAFVPAELKSTVAARIVSIVSTFNTSIQGTPEQLWAPFSIVAFIFKYIKCEDFANYMKTVQNKSEFADFLHFYIVKTKYTKTLGTTATAASNVAALNSIEKQFESLGPGGAFGSIKGRSGRAAGRRDFKAMRASFNPTIQAQPSYIPAKDIALEVQYGIVNIIEHLLNMEEPQYDLAIDILFHVLSMNISVEAVEGIVESVSLFIQKNVKFLIENRAPPFILVLKKLLSLTAAKNRYTSEKFATVYPVLFAAEKEAYGTNNRTHVQITRAVSLLSVEDLGSSTLINSLKLLPEEEHLSSVIKMISRLSEINERLKAIDREGFMATFAPDFEMVVPKATKSTEMDEYGDLLWERACILSPSPDAMMEALKILDQFHAANDYKIESIVTKIVQCALLAEYLTPLELMPKVFAPEHPALSFTRLTPVAATVIATDEVLKDFPVVPGFCDSPIFCEAGIVSILYEIADFCQSEQLFEIINQTIHVFVPLFEYHQMYEELQSLFAKCQDYYQFLDSTPKLGERLMGKYYRVCFFGECFKSDNGKMYIYRETKLTNLFTLTNRFEATYGKLLPPGKLEIIKESGAVDTRLLEPDKGYIQITFVNPTFDKKEANLRQTSFEINSHVKKFSFETPFMKGSKKLQGSVENQWLRRTFLNIRNEMPSVTKRVELLPEDIVNVEYEPIRVSCRQLKERLTAYELAIQTKSISQIQPLLNGSLCVQVNEGPTKMAEVFLGGNLKTKYTEKMRAVFKKFLELNKVALEIHREASNNNPNFAALQEQMDIGYESLSKKLAPYLNI